MGSASGRKAWRIALPQTHHEPIRLVNDLQTHSTASDECFCVIRLQRGKSAQAKALTSAWINSSNMSSIVTMPKTVGKASLSAPSCGADALGGKILPDNPRPQISQLLQGETAFKKHRQEKRALTSDGHRVSRGSDSMCSFSMRTWMTSSSCSSAVTEADLSGDGSTNAALRDRLALPQDSQQCRACVRQRQLSDDSHVASPALEQMQDLVQAGVCLHAFPKSDSAPAHCSLTFLSARGLTCR